MRFVFRQAWNNIRVSWGVFLQTLTMMFVCLFLLGAFGVLVLQIERVLACWEAEAPLLVFLEEDISAARKKKILKAVREMPEAGTIKEVSPKQAMRRLQQSMGSQGRTLRDIDTPLLPPTLEIELKPASRTLAVLRRLRLQLQGLRGVTEVDAAGQWFAPLWTLASWLRLILWSGGLLLLLCTSLMAAGTIRLSLFLHRDEIDIMRLIGATERFIRAPFYLEGAMAGGGAALFALSSLYGLFFAIQTSYGASFFAFTSVKLYFAPILWCLLFALGGLSAGTLGAWVAIRSSSKGA